MAVRAGWEAGSQGITRGDGLLTQADQDMEKVSQKRSNESDSVDGIKKMKFEESQHLGSPFSNVFFGLSPNSARG